MFFVRIRIDKDIVEVNDDELIEEFTEDIIDERLEGRRRIC